MHKWPTQVLLELTNGCDLRCRHCHYHGDGVRKGRAVGQMTAAVWRAALAEIAAWRSPVTVQPWGMGEPLLHPDLWEFVGVAKRARDLAVGFYSNGMQWRDADFAAAIDAGLDWVCFSVDGLDPERFAHYRQGAELDRVVASIEALADARERAGATAPRIRINMVQYPDQRAPDHRGRVAEFVERWRGIADSVTVSRFRPIGSRRFSPIELPRVACYQLDTVLAVAWDGHVAMCCEDPHVAEPVGRFPERSLADIWNGVRLTTLRAAHRAGDFGASALCRDCDGWSAAYSRDRVANGMTIRERTSATIYEFGTA